MADFGYADDPDLKKYDKQFAVVHEGSVLRLTKDRAAAEQGVYNLNGAELRRVKDGELVQLEG